MIQVTNKMVEEKLQEIVLACGEDSDLLFELEKDSEGQDQAVFAVIYQGWKEDDTHEVIVAKNQESKKAAFYPFFVDAKNAIEKIGKGLDCDCHHTSIVRVVKVI